MAKAAAPNEMQLAEILSDLVSLRPGVCVCSSFHLFQRSSDIYKNALQHMANISHVIGPHSSSRTRVCAPFVVLHHRNLLVHRAPHRYRDG